MMSWILIKKVFVVCFIFNMIQFANWQAGEGLPKGRVLYCFGEVATFFLWLGFFGN